MTLHLNHSYRIHFLIGIIFIITSHLTFAQSYPNRSIRLVVPFTAGGGTDISARIVSQRLSEQLGVAIVVDNRNGAGGIIGTDIVAKSAPDGYTLGLVSSSHSINISLHKSLPYDTVKDFTPISLVVYAPGMLVTTLTLPVSNLKEFISLAKSKPNQLTYGSAGNGTPTHLAMELLKSSAKIDINHVPYKGAGSLLPDLLNGQIVAAIPSAASVISMIQSGKIRGIAVTSITRTAAAPNIPTMSESGLNGYDANSWYGMVGPAHVPSVIVKRIHSEIQFALKTTQVSDKLIALALDPVGNTPEQFLARIRNEIKKWERIIQSSGAKLD